MGLRILVAPDKFKGTLTAAEAAEAIRRGWRRNRRGDTFDLAPISDGGDGFGPIMSRALKARAVRTRTVDAAHRPVTATWWWCAATRTAVVESANVIGLAMLPKGKFHPRELDTRGLGEVLRAVAAKGARKCLVGIGGSATNDGGFGMARVLGWSFLRRNGEPCESWAELADCVRVTAPRKRRIIPRITVAVDVQNPLLGRLGCSRIYGPQKGLTAGDQPAAEKALRTLARRVEAFRDRGRDRDLAGLPGAGAAGGLGFGLTAFLGAEMRPGFELIARTLQLRSRLRAADLVLTGEGSLDASTAMGKGVGELALLAERVGVPCVGLAGQVSVGAALGRLFRSSHGLTDITSTASALRRPGHWLERLSARAAADFEA